MPEEYLVFTSINRPQTGQTYMHRIESLVLHSYQPFLNQCRNNSQKNPTKYCSAHVHSNESLVLGPILKRIPTQFLEIRLSILSLFCRKKASKTCQCLRVQHLITCNRPILNRAPTSHLKSKKSTLEWTLFV